MWKRFWIAPLLVAAGWSQTQPNWMNVVPMRPVGGFVVAAGTELHVRVDGPLSTNGNQPGDRFGATLTDPVMANGQTVIPAGTRIAGHVQANRQAGVIKGRAELTLALDSFALSGHTYTLELTAATFQREHPHRALENADPNAKAVVGNRDQATIPAESIVTFTLGSPVRL
jgi:hypothetical protein